MKLYSIRPFGLLGRRYSVDASGRAYYLCAWAVSVAFCLAFALLGALIKPMPVLAMSVIFVVSFFSVIRLLAVAMKNPRLDQTDI